MNEKQAFHWLNRRKKTIKFQNGPRLNKAISVQQKVKEKKGDKKVNKFNCKLKDDGDQIQSHRILTHDIFCFIFFAFVLSVSPFIVCHRVCKLRGAEMSSVNAKVNKV